MTAPDVLTPGDLQTAERILALRMAAGVTPRRLSRMAKLLPNVVGDIECGRRAATPEEVAALARVLDVEPSDLTAAVTA